jgi:glutamyl/glutaminyl-tRNA synthetase
VSSLPTIPSGSSLGDARALRAVPYWLFARRRRAHGAVSTGYSRDPRAANSSCALRTPTPSAIARNWSREFSTASSGWASIGMKARSFNPRRTRAVRRRGGTNCWRRARRIFAIVRPEKICRRRRRRAWRSRCAKRAAPRGALRMPRTRRPPSIRRPGPCPRAKSSRGDDLVSRGEASAVRFRVPLAQTTQFDDAVFGPREISNDEIEDFVLLRSPRAGQQQGLPTYQLCAVVDDVEMRITHLIRGADHLSNTPKQVLLYRALGAAVPIFAHVPLILGPDRTRLSKRHGATSVGSYRDEGFLSEAFANFLALARLVARRRFRISAHSRACCAAFRSPASAAPTPSSIVPKLEWFNQQYLQKLPIEELLPIVEAELRRAGNLARRMGRRRRPRMVRAHRRSASPAHASCCRISRIGAAHFSATLSTTIPPRCAKFWKDQRIPALIARLADALAALTEWNHDACDAALRQTRRVRSRESRPAHQRRARLNRRPSRRPAALRDHARPRPAPRSRPACATSLPAATAVAAAAPPAD